MPKDIKKRERQEKFIRKLDKNAIYTSKIKRNFQNSYRKISEKKNEEKESESSTNYASSNIMKSVKENIKLTGYLSYDVSKIAYKKIKSRLAENNAKKSARTTQSEQMNKKLVNAKSDSKAVPDEKIIKKPNNKSETLSNTKKQINNKIKNISKELGKKIIKRSKKYRIVAYNSGGVVLIIIIIVIIASIFGSALGFLFSNETPQTEENMPISSAIDYLEKELEEKIATVKQNTDYDTLEVKNKDVAWKEVLTIYAVIATNRETNFNIMKMDKQNYQKLSEIFWNVVEVEHYTETYKVKVVTTDADGNKVVKTKTKTRLVIDVQAMSLEEMMEYYNMSKSERKQVEEMTSSQFDEMWEKVMTGEQNTLI